MEDIRNVLLRLVFATVLSALAVLSASGQLTIINTPSTDTLQAKMFYVELDFASNLKSYRKNGFQTYGYRTVYGFNRKTEAGVTLFYTRTGVTKPIEAQFSLKRKLYANEKRGLASAAGLTVYVPLNVAAGDRTVAMAYGNISKSVKRAKGLRVTSGIYQILNGGKQFGAKTGLTLAVEQPILRRTTFVADWSSGRNRFGYLAAGVNFAISKKQSVTASYNVGNSGQYDNFFSVFYSIYF